MVIDDVFANKYFPGKDPIGKRIQINRFPQLAEIVGVVGHVKQWGLDNDETQSLRSGLYIPCDQMPDDFIAIHRLGRRLWFGRTMPREDFTPRCGRSAEK